MPVEGLVYVIDDDPAMRDSLDFLLDAAGLKARLFESAVSFLEALPELGPGCIVSDVRMPNLDGLELLKRLRETNKSLPIIIMTGHGDIPLAVEAMKLGAIDFIEKPFEDDRLIGTIKAAGQTPQDLQQTLTKTLGNGYLLNPRVSVEVLSYRPIYILGEVNKPGEYDYVPGMTVLAAIAKAEGFTYRAQEKSIFLKRQGSDREVEIRLHSDTPIHPGDTLRIGERYF